MNRFTLRLTWLAVKAAEWLLPIAWTLCKIAFYLLLLSLALFILVIIL